MNLDDVTLMNLGEFTLMKSNLNAYLLTKPYNVK